jgi:rhodanese-related sulfurtransferase
MRQMTASELDARLRAGDEPPLLLDVREPWEFAICRIDGAQLLPMGSIVASLDQLERDRDTVVICHHGIRSQQVAYFLERQGFSRIVNLVGGVAAWARDVDRDMATY